MEKHLQGLPAESTFRKVTRIGMSERQMRNLSRGSRRMASTKTKSMLTDVLPQASFSTPRTLQVNFLNTWWPYNDSLMTMTVSVNNLKR